MDGFTNGVVAPERETHIGDPAGNHGVGQGALDVAHRFNEIHGVVVVLFDPGGNGEDVGVENNVFRRETHFFGEQFVGTGANFHLALTGICLAFLIESHDDHGSTVTPQ